MKVLISEDEIRATIRRLADEIKTYYEGRPLTIIGVMTGSVVLLADLIRLLDMPLRVGVVQTRSYRGADTSPGPLAINADMLPDVRGREVLLLDDIFDTGHTLFELLAQFDELEPASVRSAVLLRKRGRQQTAVDPDHVGFEIPDVFVVGYGLDYHDLYRNLPYVAALDDEDLAVGSDS